MPKKPKIKDEQRAEVLGQLALGKSINTIHKNTGFSVSSINRIKADIGAVYRKRKKTPQDVRIQRLLGELGLNTDLVEESLLRKLKTIAKTDFKAVEVLELIKERDKAMKGGSHKNYNLADRKAGRVPEPMQHAIINGSAERLDHELKKSSIDDSLEAWRNERDVQEALYRKIKGVGAKKRMKTVMSQAQEKRWEAWKKEHDKDVALCRRLQGISETDKKA
jgi:hypothetical protein